MADEFDVVDVVTDGPSYTDDGEQDLLNVDPEVAQEIASLAAEVDADDETAKSDGVRTRRQATRHALAAVRSGLAIWYGLCLFFVRDVPFNVDRLYPDARTAWREAERRHRFDGDYDAVPGGKPFFYRIGIHDHVVYTLGRGKCVSTDVVEHGKPDVVMLAAIAEKWRARPLGHTDDLNGEDVPAPRPRRRRVTRAFKVKTLRFAIVRARAAGEYGRVGRLRHWLAQVRK
jgi:hypothetical protein